MRPFHACCLLTLLALLAWAAPCRADERILDYHADIVLAADGSMRVTEHIRVQAEGERIRHGIYRDFPTDYRDRLHNRYRVTFKLVSVERDGQSEPSHNQRQGNGIRVYMGDSDSEVAPGEHEYVIRYDSNRQLGFFADHDELFWNVTGTGWDFPIDHASARVHLPHSVDPAQLKTFGYTGAQDSREAELTSHLEADGASYATTRTLAPHQGLTIGLQFPVGVIAKPSSMQRLYWLLQDNRNLLLGLLGLVLLWLYYGWSWNRYGRDPAAGVRIAEYEPPDGLSPAALRYVRRMGFDGVCFTAAILGIAAKGGLAIEQDETGQYSATRSTPSSSPLAADEQALSNALFAGSDSVSFTQVDRVRVAQAQLSLKNILTATYDKRAFVTNSVRMLPGVVITALTLLAVASSNAFVAGFMMVWLTGWTFAVCFLFVQAYQASASDAKGALILWFMAAVFGAGEVGGMIMLGSQAGYAILPVFFVLIGTNVAFYYWMKAPTQSGAKLLDRIEGFRWYLGVAEKQELDSRYTPQSRPELFGAYLPYALALDVGNAWAQRFAEALSAEQLQQAQPRWYHGNSLGQFSGNNFTSFSSGLTSGIGGAIASASVAPGSSSGSGGGSGGGGGGGGGGGW